MNDNAFTDQEVHQQLEQLNQELEQPWTFVDGKLCKQFVFANFVHAFSFMTRVAIHCEKINHHPEWSNVYKTVDIALCSHDVSGISSRDFDLARRIESVSA